MRNNLNWTLGRAADQNNNPALEYKNKTTLQNKLDPEKNHIIRHNLTQGIRTKGEGNKHTVTDIEMRGNAPSGVSHGSQFQKQCLLSMERDQYIFDPAWIVL